jgi:hypothetical protein
MTNLSVFLAVLARERFTYGESDCAMVIGRWWEMNHGVNPIGHLKDAYSDRESCDAILARGGGLLRLASAAARSVGAIRASDFKPGDFGVVRFQRAHFGAIRTPSNKWAIKCGDGLVATSECKPLAIWSI